MLWHCGDPDIAPGRRLLHLKGHCPDRTRANNASPKPMDYHFLGAKDCFALHRLGEEHTEDFPREAHSRNSRGTFQERLLRRSSDPPCALHCIPVRQNSRFCSVVGCCISARQGAPTGLVQHLTALQQQAGRSYGPVCHGVH